jgi:hypothetical protein
MPHHCAGRGTITSAIRRHLTPTQPLIFRKALRNDRTAPVPAACSLPAAGGERPRARCRRTKHAISAPATQKEHAPFPIQAVLMDINRSAHHQVRDRREQPL